MSLERCEAGPVTRFHRKLMITLLSGFLHLTLISDTFSCLAPTSDAELERRYPERTPWPEALGVSSQFLLMHLVNHPRIQGYLVLWPSHLLFLKYDQKAVGRGRRRLARRMKSRFVVIILALASPWVLTLSGLFRILMIGPAVPEIWPESAGRGTRGRRQAQPTESWCVVPIFSLAPR